MAFYDLSKTERARVVESIHRNILKTLQLPQTVIPEFFSDEDTYIRKSAYLAIGRIYFQEPDLQSTLIKRLEHFMLSSNQKVRQTTVNAAGEIGIKGFDAVEHFFDTGLFDTHHSVRNAVIGSIKKMGAKNPTPVLTWAKKYLHHPDKEVRREICHGIELRGRKHPQDILPLLKELEFDTTARVKNTLIHVLGQIAYKKGCLATVVEELKNWNNKELVHKALAEIIDVHDRYKNFTALNRNQAVEYIDNNYKRY